MATATQLSTRILPDEFLELPDRDRYELVDGELVEMPVLSLEGSAIASRWITRLQPFADAHPAAMVMTGEATRPCFSDEPNPIRRPGVCFIPKGRLPPEPFEQEHGTIPADFAVVTGESALPGFEVRVADLFPNKSAVL